MSSRPFRRQCLRKGSMSKWAWKPSVVGDGLGFEVDGDFVLRVGGAALDEGFYFGVGEADEDDAVLAGVGEEDVGEGGGDDGAEAVLVDGPGGVLAGGAAAEVALGEEDFGALVLGLVEDEGGVGLAGVGAFLDAAPVVEEEVFVAGALDAFQELLGDDLVRVDVGERERGGGGGEGVDGSHRGFSVSSDKTRAVCKVQILSWRMTEARR